MDKICPCLVHFGRAEVFAPLVWAKSGHRDFGDAATYGCKRKGKHTVYVLPPNVFGVAYVGDYWNIFVKTLLIQPFKKSSVPGYNYFFHVYYKSLASKPYS